MSDLDRILLALRSTRADVEHSAEWEADTLARSTRREIASALEKLIDWLED